MQPDTLRKALLRWYAKNARDLPWRRTRDPYAIWISEIMLQQTRVAAAISYYERFLRLFPDVRALAAAPEGQVLAAWSGLGYYSRARNLHQAAKAIDASGAFPNEYAAIRALPGVGDYTAAAIASLAFDLPYAVVDGNVKRVIARISGDGGVDVQDAANRLLDRQQPAQSNQALMELGALLCLPRNPLCERCPVAGYCEARRLGKQAELPLKKARQKPDRLRLTLFVVRRGGKLLLTPSPRVRGFWDLPEPSAEIRAGAALGTFRHSIMNRAYTCVVQAGEALRVPRAARWWPVADLEKIPLSTTVKKAMRLVPRASSPYQ